MYKITLFYPNMQDFYLFLFKKHLLRRLMPQHAAVHDSLFSPAAERIL
jgi:hypothetical protein